MASLTYSNDMIGVGSNAPSKQGITPFIGPIQPKPTSTRPNATRNTSTTGFSSGMSGSVGGGGGGGGGGSSQPAQKSGPSDADFDRVGVARGDVGGYNRVVAEQAAKDAQQNQMYRTPEGWDFQGAQDQYLKQVEDTFNKVMGYINENAGLLQQSRTTAEQQAEADLAANQALLGQQRSEATRSLQEQGITAEKKKEDALSQARRLYTDLSQASQRRFGALSGAGQAMNDVLGRQLQQNFGSIGSQAADVQREIAQGIQTVDEKFNTGMMQLQQSVQTAKAKIFSDFTNAMMQINNMKGAAESEKGNAKLQALQWVRDQAAALNMQQVTFQQQLEAMREQQKMNLESYAQTAGAATTAGGSALMNFNPTYNAFSEVPAGTEFAQPVQMQGMIVRGKDYQGRTIWEDPRTGKVTYGWTNPQTG